MLRIAVQSKGRLFEETMALLEEADIKIPSSKRILLVQSTNFPVEILFLRDDDIPQSVACGVAGAPCGTSVLSISKMIPRYPCSYNVL